MLMVLIAATGNYTFFNLLTAALCVTLLDDDHLRALASGPRSLLRALTCRWRTDTAASLGKQKPAARLCATARFAASLQAMSAASLCCRWSIWSALWKLAFLVACAASFLSLFTFHAGPASSPSYANSANLTQLLHQPATSLSPDALTEFAHAALDRFDIRLAFTLEQLDRFLATTLPAAIVWCAAMLLIAFARDVWQALPILPTPPPSSKSAHAATTVNAKAVADEQLPTAATDDSVVHSKENRAGEKHDESKPAAAQTRKRNRDPHSKRDYAMSASPQRSTTAAAASREPFVDRKPDMHALTGTAAASAGSPSLSLCTRGVALMTAWSLAKSCALLAVAGWVFAASLTPLSSIHPPVSTLSACRVVCNESAEAADSRSVPELHPPGVSNSGSLAHHKRLRAIPHVRR